MFTTDWVGIYLVFVKFRFHKSFETDSICHHPLELYCLEGFLLFYLVTVAEILASRGCGKFWLGKNPVEILNWALWYEIFALKILWIVLKIALLKITLIYADFRSSSSISAANFVEFPRLLREWKSSKIWPL